MNLDSRAEKRLNVLVTVSRTISMGHRLPSYDGICSSLHGHNVKFEASVRVDAGFLDFKQVDAWLEYILEDLDHAMVLFDKDPVVPDLQKLSFQRLVLLSVEPTTEALAQYVLNQLSSKCYVDCVTVYETAKYQATCRAAADEVFRTDE